MPMEMRDNMFKKWLDDGRDLENETINRLKQAFDAGWEARKKAVDYVTSYNPKIC